MTSPQSIVQLKVGVLEDDADLRESILIPQLRKFNFEVTGFEIASDLFQAMSNQSFDLLVLDINLPDMDGFTVAQRLRENFAIGIVVLTGRRDPEDQVKGLTEAADAWLIKPVEVNVLAATLRSLARRIGMSSDQSLAGTARWRLSPEGHQLIGPNSAKLALNYSEQRLLARLFETPGQPIVHEELIRALTVGLEVISLHRLEMLIHRLRRKVSAEIGTSLPLRSVRGRGYAIHIDD